MFALRDSRGDRGERRALHGHLGRHPQRQLCQRPPPPALTGVARLAHRPVRQPPRLTEGAEHDRALVGAAKAARGQELQQHHAK
jgi:hypothetical protein